MMFFFYLKGPAHAADKKGESLLWLLTYLTYSDACIVWKINERGEQGEHDDDDNAKMAKLNDVGSFFYYFFHSTR